MPEHIDSHVVLLFELVLVLTRPWLSHVYFFVGAIEVESTSLCLAIVATHLIYF